MAPLLAAVLPDGAAVAVFARCPASINASVREQQWPGYNELCADTYRAAIKAIQNKEFDGVVLAGFWTGHMTTLYDDEIKAGTLQGGLRLTERGLLKVIGDIGQSATIALIGDVPQFDKDPIPCQMIGSLQRAACAPPAITREQFDERQGETYKMLRDVAARQPAITEILPGAALCNSASCVTKIEGTFLYRDQNHIRRNLPPSIQHTLAMMMGLSQIFTQ
jgi:hypothetical protein